MLRELKIITNQWSYLMVILSLSFIIVSCEDNSEVGFTVDFNYEFIDDNNVKFTNNSKGEYYSLDWDFAIGETVSTTDKNKTYTIYYPEAGDYAVRLSVLDYTGNSKIATKTVSITKTDLVVSFTASIDVSKPNYVNLENTTTGNFDSFKWIFGSSEIENEAKTVAHFPLAGKYEIELQVAKGSNTFSKKQSVNIVRDDPDYSGIVWQEEFDYKGLPDAKKWNMDIGGDGWGNAELQYYTNLQRNAWVENGVLTITAIKENYSGRQYTSARINTFNKFDFKYGKIEARIKLPYGKGIWPAFWMLGRNIGAVGWPACGEIDIMEMFGGPEGDNTVHSTLHWENDGQRAEYGQKYSLNSGIFADNFHIFSLEWNDKQVVAFVDGIQYFLIDITPGQLSEFHKNFYILLNLAVGGNRPGSPDNTTKFPQTMKIDYVRVYKENN